MTIEDGAATALFEGNVSQEWLAEHYPIQVPISVNWDITNACNLGCLHCYASSGKRFADELSDDEARAFATQLVEDKVLRVTIAGGEPLLRPVTVELLETLANGGVDVSFVTNGTLVNPDFVKKVKSIKLRGVAVSVDGSNASTHDAIRFRNGSFSSAIQALRLLSEAGIRTSLNMAVNTRNIHEVPDVIELAIGIGCQTVTLLRVQPVGRARNNPDLLLKEEEAIRQLASQLVPEVPRWSKHVRFTTSDPTLLKVLKADTDLSVPIHSGCQAGRTLAWVDPRGDVFGCVYLPIRFGNVRESSLREIWTQKIVRDVRKAAVSNGLSCGSCSAAIAKMKDMFEERVGGGVRKNEV